MRNDSLIGLQKSCKPIFFSILTLLISCTHPEKNSPAKISIIWNDNRATGLSISKQQIVGIPDDSLRMLVQVRLAESSSKTPISGDYKILQDEVVFSPLIPFTRGLRYAVFSRERLLGEIEIDRSTEAPELITIYPSKDTVPENLLKIYLVFNKPMVEGRALQYISLIGQGGDTLQNIFLELHPELWNQKGTILTLWFDPGRIKRDLQPNKLLGPPLVNGEQYTIFVSEKWPDIQGATLSRSFSKHLVAAIRDTLSPRPSQWKVKPPAGGTIDPLVVDFGESLDYMLLQTSVTLTDQHGNEVNGKIQISNEEKNFNFTPSTQWFRGLYKIRIESKLEDLAGNNLNRPFDRDLSKPNVGVATKDYLELEWRVE